MSECLEKKTNESKKGSITQTILDKICHAVQTAIPENPRAEAHFPNTVQDNDVFKQNSRGRKRNNPSGLSKISSGIQDFVERYLLKFSNRKRSRRSFLSRSHAIEVHSLVCLLRKFSYILLKERAALAADRIRVKYLRSALSTEPCQNRQWNHCLWRQGDFGKAYQGDACISHAMGRQRKPGRYSRAPVDGHSAHRRLGEHIQGRTSKGVSCGTSRPGIYQQGIR